MNTKEKIIYEALGLFSRKGFDSVYMNEIAEAVGIKTPSLYKHYKSKQAIFDACCDTFYEKIRAESSIIGLPDNNEMQAYYSKVTLVEMINNTIQLFEYHLSDYFVSNFRKLLMIERYNSPELDIQFKEIYIESVITQEEEIFKMMITNNVIPKNDSHVLAVKFYSPLFFLLQKYDLDHEKIDEAKKEIELVVTDFYYAYMEMRIVK